MILSHILLGITFVLHPTISHCGEFRFIKSYQWNNIRQAIARGGLLYCGLDEGLEIMDISDPRAPRVIGQCIAANDGNSTAFFCDMVLSGSYIFMARYEGGLHVFDISDAQRPRVISKADGRIGKVTVYDSLLITGERKSNSYSVSGKTDCLRFFIIDSLKTLRLRSEVPISGSIDVIEIAGGFVFVGINDEEYHSAGSGVLKVFDVSHISAPVEVSSYKPFGSVGALSIRDRYAFLLVGDQGLQVLDVSEPRDIKIVAEAKCKAGGYHSNIVLQGNYAFLSPCCDENCVFDVGDPLNPKLINNAPIDKNYGFFSICDGLAYASLQAPKWGRDRSAAIGIFDVSDPTDIFTISVIGESSHFKEVAISGNYAYLTDLDRGLYILDISRPPGSELISIMPLNESSTRTVCAYRGYVYVETKGEHWDDPDTLVVIDIKKPSNPIIVARYPVAHGFDGLYAYGDLLFMYGAFAYIQVFDIKKPSRLKLIRELPIELAGSKSMVAQRGLMYAADGSLGLKIIDIAEIKKPRLIGSLDLTSARSVAVKGEYAFIADYEDGLVVINVSDPSRPALVSSTKAEQLDGPYGQHQFLDVYVSGDYAFLRRAISGIVYAFDVTDPSRPVVADSYGGFFGLDGFFVDGNSIYLPVMQNLIVLEWESE